MSFSSWFCREWENHPYDVEMALPLILQKSERFVPPYIIGISSIRLNWVASTVLIQYDSVPRTQSKQRWFTALGFRRAMMCSPPGFWIHHVEDRQCSRSHVWVGRRRRKLKRGSKVYSRAPPQWPMMFVGIWRTILSEILHEFETNLFPEKYSSWIHEWEVRMGRLRSITINFWLSHGHPSGFGSRKLIFPHQKRGRKEPSDFESNQNFIIQKFPRQWSNGNDSDDDLRCFSRLGGLRFTE